MKNILFFSIMIMVVVGLSAQTAIQPTGTGDVNNPFLIGSLENLYWIAVSNQTWGCYFVQIAHIDASDTENWFTGEGWIPIGTDLEPFTGFYDGDGFVISNLFIDRNTRSKIGLFGSISGAELTGINLSSVDITGGRFVGGLVGYATGSAVTESLIEGCHVTGFVEEYDPNSSEGGGGLIGKVDEYTTIEGCSSNTTVTGTNYLGGLVGANNGGIITGSSSSGEVIGAGYTVGGLVGLNIDGAEIFECYSSANVSAPGFGIGGLAGVNTLSLISYCYATGNVRGDWQSNQVGGLIGNNGGDVQNSYSTGFVVGGTDVGGLIGSNTGSVVDSYWDKESSGWESSAGGEGLLTHEMLWEDNYVNWSFNGNPWKFKNPNVHIREAYPILDWQIGPSEHNFAEAMVKLYQQRIRHYWESFPRLVEQGDYNYTVALLDP